MMLITRIVLDKYRADPSYICLENPFRSMLHSILKDHAKAKQKAFKYNNRLYFQMLTSRKPKSYTSVCYYSQEATIGGYRNSTGW